MKILKLILPIINFLGAAFFFVFEIIGVVERFAYFNGWALAFEWVVFVWAALPVVGLAIFTMLFPESDKVFKRLNTISANLLLISWLLLFFLPFGIPRIFH